MNQEESTRKEIIYIIKKLDLIAKNEIDDEDEKNDIKKVIILLYGLLYEKD